MEHHDTNENISKEQIMFNDYIRRGDDFVKISIYRNALEWYEKALQTGINDELVKGKINECKRKIKHDNMIIWILVVVAIIVVGIVLLLN
jgi:hypothetical protein